jgi:hypothetical protein
MNTTDRSDLSPRLLIEPGAIASHLETLDNAVLCAACRDAAITVTADTVALLIEAIRLWNALCQARLESANRLAAMRAALHADAEGEPDPLAYLRDELPDAEAPGTDGGCA